MWKWNRSGEGVGGEDDGRGRVGGEDDGRGGVGVEVV
jgi:hypothetical protein